MFFTPNINSVLLRIIITAEYLFGENNRIHFFVSRCRFTKTSIEDIIAAESLFDCIKRLKIVHFFLK